MNSILPIFCLFFFLNLNQIHHLLDNISSFGMYRVDKACVFTENSRNGHQQIQVNIEPHFPQFFEGNHLTMLNMGNVLFYYKNNNNSNISVHAC
jgi:hypothetical protein